MALKVLVIDDDASMTELIALYLHQHNMEIRTCTSGMQGIEFVRSEHFDIILLDLLLPGIDGWEVCKTLRGMTAAPIAILSALGDPGTISSALDAGADDYIVKPVRNRELLAHIENLTRRYRVESDASVMLRDFEMGNPVQNEWNSQEKPLQA